VFSDFDTNNLHPDDATRVSNSWLDAINSGAHRWQEEFRYGCADGTYKNVIDQAYIIRDEKGKAIRMIGSMQDVTEERRLQTEVLENEMRKKTAVLNAIIEAQEKERKEISCELHDNVNQLLAASILFFKTAAREKGSSPLIEQGLDHVNKAISEIRSLSHSLNPGALKVNGLFFALSDLTRKISIPGKFEAVLKAGISFNEEQIKPALKLTIYRIAQECVNNILKHSGADRVKISLDCSDEIVSMSITDNGQGFDVDPSNKGIGLVNIFNRVETAGGQAEIISSPGNGCTVKVQLPTA
jgi:two-component system sensor histidine kinase UhpB